MSTKMQLVTSQKVKSSCFSLFFFTQANPNPCREMEVGHSVPLSCALTEWRCGKPHKHKRGKAATSFTFMVGDQKTLNYPMLRPLMFILLMNKAPANIIFLLASSRSHLCWWMCRPRPGPTWCCWGRLAFLSARGRCGSEWGGQPAIGESRASLWSSGRHPRLCSPAAVWKRLRTPWCHLGRETPSTTNENQINFILLWPT